MIQLTHVSKWFQSAKPHLLRDYILHHHKPPPPFWALRDISFRIEHDQSVGIIGRNGAGKSTLLALLCGIADPDEGSLRVEGRLSALLQLGAGFHDDLTGRENVYLNAALLGLSRREAKDAFNRIVEFSEMGDFIDQPLRVYSSGMNMRLAFAVAVQVRPEVLLIDEVLAVGDAAFQQKCTRTIQGLKESGTSLVLVSHDLDSVRALSDQVLWLDHGRVVMFGQPGDVIAAYREQVVQPQRIAAP